MLHINTVHVQRETLWVSSWLGKSTRWFVVHEHVNIPILLSLLWDCVHSSVWKVSSAHRGECYYRWFVQAHSPVCSTLWIAQKSFIQFFLFGVYIYIFLVLVLLSTNLFCLLHFSQLDTQSPAESKLLFCSGEQILILPVCLSVCPLCCLCPHLYVWLDRPQLPIGEEYDWKDERTEKGCMLPWG